MDKGNIRIYQNNQGNVNIDVRLYEDTVWPTQRQMQLLFQKAKPTISEHIKSIFQEGELDPNSVVRNFRITTSDGKDYFKELLDRVRSIRASEPHIYQKITDIFAECSIDYNPKSPITRNSYASVQNKFHFAITGKTPAELIYTKADSKKENMGLNTWKSAQKGRILKSDTTIAKNYLNETQIKQLERTVTGL